MSNNLEVHFTKETKRLLVILFIVFIAALSHIVKKSRSDLKYYRNQTRLIELQYNLYSHIPIEAESVHVYNFSQNQTIYGKNDETEQYIASITKLSTALLSEELAPNKITIRAEDFTNSEKNYIDIGQIWKKEDLEQIMLVSSSNNIAEILAKNSDGVNFISALNDKMKVLGFNRTHFINESGLDQHDTGNTSTAKEVTQISKVVYEKIPTIVSATTEKEFSLKDASGNRILVENTNQSVDTIPNILLSKTGYTDLAKGNLTILYKSEFNNDLIGITVLGSSREGRFTDVTKIMHRTDLFMKMLKDDTMLYEELN